MSMQDEILAFIQRVATHGASDRQNTRSARELLKRMIDQEHGSPPQSPTKPIAWQYRTHFDNSEVWTDWVDCSLEQHERIQRNGKIGMYRAESRPLYAAPLPRISDESAGVREALDCMEFMPLMLKPMADPNCDDGEHWVLDSETAYVFKLHCSRDRAERIVAALNAAAPAIEIEKLRKALKDKPDVRAATIEECVQFLEREGHGIPAEKLRSLAPVVTRPDRGGMAS